MGQFLDFTATEKPKWKSLPDCDIGIVCGFCRRRSAKKQWITESRRFDLCGCCAVATIDDGYGLRKILVRIDDGKIGCPPFVAPTPRANKGAFVYFVQQAKGGPIKIGWSLHNSRLAKMQAENQYELILLATTPGDHRREREIHRQFDHLRTHGEWFKSASDLLQFIESIRKAVSHEV